VKNETARHELRALAARFPDDLKLQEILAFAHSLPNTLVRAKELERHETLLKQLRQLARVHADDTAIQLELAKGLFNTLSDAKQEGQSERCDALLDELRQLARACADDSTLREQFATGLLLNMCEVDDRNRIAVKNEEAREELRLLAARFPQDVKLRDILAVAQSLPS
jgi:hypothetical protein